jgi:glycosyltransferase involved in cell wall biosynthesis
MTREPTQRRGQQDRTVSAAPGRRVLHVMRMSGVSGSENHLLELVAGLRAHGWESDVLIPSPDPPSLREFAERLATVCAVVEVVSMRSDASPRLVRRLVRALRSGRYDLVHAHLVHADWHLALAGLFASGVPLVTTKHNPDPFRARLAFRLAERAALRRYRAVIAISDALRDFLADTLGVKARTVRYGLAAPDRPPARADSSDTRFLAVGRLEEQKGFDVAVEAMARVVDQVPEARLAFAGEGGKRPELTAAIERLGLGDAVQLLGRREDVSELMAAADALVHPARWEGFGLVLLEAMRSALPIVATRAGAIPEVVDDGVTGTLVPPEDPAALAGALVELARQPALGREFGLAGFARLRAHFSPETMARETAALYDSLFGGR